MARGGKGGSGRRYVRDNRGRFASKGAGATARGGRLKTTSGKKRATQTMKASGGVSGTIGKPKGLKPGTIKAKPQVSSARQAATDRLKIKTATRRKLKADRSSVIPTQPKAQRLQSSRPASTVAKKPRAKGNKPATVARRIDRKAAVNQANLRMMSRYGNSPDPRQYGKAIRQANTLNRAKEFTKTGKLPGRDNSIKAQRERKAAGERLAAKRAARQAAKAKPTRKQQLEAGAKRNRAKADKNDAKVAKLEKEYRSKDPAFYTQGVKPAGRDRMIAKSQQAAKLRQESAALRTKATNAERMARKIKDKPAKPTTSSNPRLQRALKNEAAGSTSFRRDPKGYAKRITALTAQKIYKTGDVTAGLSIRDMAGKGFRLPRSKRGKRK